MPGALGGAAAGAGSYGPAAAAGLRARGRVGLAGSPACECTPPLARLSGGGSKPFSGIPSTAFAIAGPKM
ncbi:hypothetical protein [Fodinicola feengrottensis]|uniref:hypothetical protein n=1 Tax=Fodinicola feengrottensis TaxID=435914 RepID=UPI0013D73F51|nr:hypothetical protein [Fodinicola feengrottensis]